MNSDTKQKQKSKIIFKIQMIVHFIRHIQLTIKLNTVLLIKI